MIEAFLWSFGFLWILCVGVHATYRIGIELGTERAAVDVWRSRFIVTHERLREMEVNGVFSLYERAEGVAIDERRYAKDHIVHGMMDKIKPYIRYKETRMPFGERRDWNTCRLEGRLRFFIDPNDYNEKDNDTK